MSLHRVMRVIEGDIRYDADTGMSIDNPEETGGRTFVGGLFGYRGYDNPLNGKRFRITIEQLDEET